MGHLPLCQHQNPARSTYDVAIRWSTPGRRQYPHDSRTTVEAAPFQRDTLRRTYRALRQATTPWDARSAVVRLLNMG